jgi:hypothetical protein
MVKIIKFVEEQSEKHLQISVFPLTQTILRFEEISKKSFGKLFRNLVSQSKFSLEKYLVDKDISASMKFSEDKENPFQYEALVILSHNFRVIIEAILEFGHYSSLTEKTFFLEEVENYVKEIVQIFKTQFESKLLLIKEKQTISLFGQFADRLITVFETYFLILYRSFNLQNLWEKIVQRDKVRLLVNLAT